MVAGLGVRECLSEEVQLGQKPAGSAGASHGKTRDKVS